MKDNQNSSEEKSKKRFIIYIIIIIIIILSLLTSCSCTSNFFGKIGDIFKNEGHHDLDNQDDLETILNSVLTFDTNYLETSISSHNASISFSYTNINPQDFTCTTSDAKIATCSVLDNHVVLNLLAPGEIKVILETITNNKKYQATTNVKIHDLERSIVLSSLEGTINLAKKSELKLSYNLLNLNGPLSASVSNNKIAKVEIKDDQIIIKGLKTGSTTINFALNYNGKIYTNSFNLTVTNSKNTNIASSNNNLGSLSITPLNSKLTPNFKSSIKNYYASVKSETKSVIVKALAADKNATVYINNQKTNSLNYELNYGDNALIIKVVAPNKVSKYYTVTINRPNINATTHSHLTDLKINKETIPNFSSDKYNYSLDVSNSTNKVDISYKLNGNASVSYTLNNKPITSLNNLPLTYGENIVVITLKEKNGTTKNYTIIINRDDLYELKLLNSPYNFDLGFEEEIYQIKYEVYKNGELTTDYNESDLAVLIPSAFQDSLDFKVTKESINLKPDVRKLIRSNNLATTLTLTYHEAKTNAKVSFNLPKYKLSSPKDTYNISLIKTSSGVSGTKDIILDTDLFKDSLVASKIDNTTLLLCTKNKNACLKISSSSDLIDSITYTKTSASSTIPLKITAHQEGFASLKITPIIYQEELKDSLIINFNITHKYLVTLSANGGLFNEVTTAYTFLLAFDEQLDLSLYDVPYKLSTANSCYYYEFLGYSLSPTGPISYNAKSIIKDLEDNLNLYAIYSDKLSPNAFENKKTLWLVDVPLFHNEKYYQEHHVSPIIYPGAAGYYIMNFENKSEDTLTITGLTLKERNLCHNTGCINMGYIILNRPLNQDRANYFFGKEKDYRLLYKHADQNQANYAFKNITFKSNERVTLKPGETTIISLFWKWIEQNDKESTDSIYGSDLLDTTIGNMVAKNETINDLYGLAIGVNYTSSSSCPKTDSDHK